MFKPDSETNEQPQEESAEQQAESKRWQEVAKNIEAQQPEKEQTKEEEKSPAELLREADAEMRKAQEEWDNFLDFADGVMKKKFGGKLIQDFNENNPKEKEFIDYWGSEEKRYRDTFKKWGVRPRSNLQRWSPL